MPPKFGTRSAGDRHRAQSHHDAAANVGMFRGQPALTFVTNVMRRAVT